MFKLDMQLFALPDNPNMSEATVGKDILDYINSGTIATPALTLLGGQRGASVTESADEIDVSSKTTGGYKSSLAGLKSWSMDLDALVMLNDDGVALVDQAYRQGVQLNVFIFYPDGNFQVGWASATDASYETPHDGEATRKYTLSGNGPLSAVSETVSIAAAADVIYYFPIAATATAVKRNDTALTSGNYTATTAGQVTIESTFLEGLTAGNHVFYITLSTGGQAIGALKLTA